MQKDDVLPSTLDAQGSDGSKNSAPKVLGLHTESDEAVAKRVQGGNANAFGILVRRYEKKIQRYGRRFLRTTEDIEDLMQEIFIKAYTNILSFDAERRFSPWLYRIAHNEYVNALKRFGREPSFPFDFDLLFPHPIAKESADRESTLRELSEEMSVCLGKLPLKYREPIVLYYFEELSYLEIADVLHIPVSTVGVRITRGKSRLRELCKEKLGTNKI